MTYAHPQDLAVVEQEDRPDPELQVLADMLTYMRPAGSKAEKEFIRKFLVPLGGEYDNAGNYWVVVGKSQVLWSSHTDTVHYFAGQQRVLFAFKDGKVMATAPASDCLGADCTTGVWIMRQMILAKVPGVYVFHRQEEVGGHGSKAIAHRRDKRLNGLKFAIAFDRKGTASVITHQMAERCCSQAFVDSIAPMLPGLYMANDGGTFTDTANYMRLIPECTNISVGYYDQHTRRESQDIEHAVLLAEAMKAFDESKLVAARDPKVVESLYDGFGFGGYRGGNVSAFRKAFDRAAYEVEYDKAQAQHERKGWDVWDDADVLPSVKAAYARDVGYESDRPRTLYELCRDFPEEVADYLEACGGNVDEICDYAGID